MPKKIYSDFSGGLCVSDRIGQRNQYFIGRAIETYEKNGYMQPGWGKTDITMTGLSSSNKVFAIVPDPTSSAVYLFTDAATAYAINSDNDTLNTNVDGSSNTYVSITNMSGGKGIVYTAKDNTTLTKFVFLVYPGDMARILVNQSNPYSSTNLKKTFLTNASFLNQSSANVTNVGNDIIEFQGYLWLTNGQYIAKYDGNGSGNYGAFTYNYFDLGPGWVAGSLFATDNYLGICANNGAFSRVYLIDGSSGTASVKIIPLEKISAVKAIKNKNGNIYFLAGRNDRKGATLNILTSNGFKELFETKTEISGVVKFLANSSNLANNNLTILESNLLIGMNTGTDSKDMIFAIDDDGRVSIPHLGGGTATATTIEALKVVTASKMYVSRLDTTYKFSSLTRNSYSTATWAPVYEELGQKARINYIKFYFKPLVSGDAITPTIDTNYGTSNTLRDPKQNATISFANDGAITSKKFKTAIDCHCFRPNLSWTSGGTAFSKIVVDYSFLPDDV